MKIRTLIVDDEAHARARVRQLLKGEADFEKVRATRQPFEVLRPAEWFAVIDGDGFEDAVAKQKTAVGYGHRRLFFRHKLPVD